jgi:hypothetical protein
MADHLKTGGRPIFLPFLAATLEDCLPAGVLSAVFAKFFLRSSVVPEELLPVFEEDNRRKWRFFRRRRVTQIKTEEKWQRRGKKPCDSKEKRRFDSGQETEDILPVKSAFSASIDGHAR